MVDFLEQLKACELFRTLNWEELQAVYASMKPVEIQAGEILVRQGDSSDSLYVLLRGRLLVKISSGKTVGQVGPGQTVGEMGLISQTPRTATVLAMRDSLLLKLDQEHFQRVWKEHPDVLFEVCKIITLRLQQTLKDRNVMHHMNLVCLRANDEVDAREFFDKLQQAFDSRFRYKIIRRSDFDASIGPDQLTGKLQEMESRYDYLFYEVDYRDKLWCDICLDMADRIMVIAPGDTPADFDEELVRLLNDPRAVHPEIRKMLVLIYPGLVQSHFAKTWLGTLSFFKHFHVGLAEPSDIARFLRHINGTAVGLVLSGGGSRGLAQAGAIKYLFEEKIPIDAFAGTSSGAINAALLSISRDYQDYQALQEEVVRKTNFKEYTIPLLSLLSSRSITTVLKSLLGDRPIEDLPRYFCCVAADLTSSSEVHLDAGLLWKAVRASISIPGVYPPVHHGGMVLVDGGVMNNLPADLLKDYFEGQGRIVAIDIGNLSPGESSYNYPLELTWPKIILAKVFHKLEMPSITDIFLRGMLVASSFKNKENVKLCDIYIKPDLEGFALLDLSRRDELFERGYAAAKESLADWQNKIGGINV